MVSSGNCRWEWLHGRGSAAGPAAPSACGRRGITSRSPGPVERVHPNLYEGRHFHTTEAKKHTLTDVITRYSRAVLPHKQTSTIPEQVRQLRSWQTHLGYYPLTDITPAILVEHRNILTQGRANGTVNRYLAVLSHAFTVAVREWQWCADNPVCKVTKPKEPQGRVRFLSEDERQRLLDSCQVSRNASLYTIVVLALSTGARRGEILSLHWSDVDLKRGMLAFRKTKNGETRVVPLTGNALGVLAHHTKIRRHNTTLVFPDRTERRPVGIREAFEYAVKRAGITNFRFYDLRHSAASYLAMGGASLAEIAEVGTGSVSWKSFCLLTSSLMPSGGGKFHIRTAASLARPKPQQELRGW